MIFGAKVVIILEKKRILYLQFGYLALFRLVIWLNNIWSFGFLPLGYLAKCCTVPDFQKIHTCAIGKRCVEQTSNA